MEKTAQYYTEKLDAVANEIRKLVRAKTITPKQGFFLESSLDKISDELEVHGVKTAKALESDAEEAYMRAAFNDPATIERDADEGYMKDFTNGGQNEVSKGMEEGKLKLPVKEGSTKTASTKLDSAKLAEKRQQK